MAHFFAQPQQFEQGRVTIKAEDAAHIKRSLRLKIGDSITVSDGREAVYTAIIKAMENDELICQITGKSTDIIEPAVDMVLVPAITKGNKMDLVIQKSVELGVKKILPLDCARVVVKLDDARRKKRALRWQRIAQEAAKQCRRLVIPEVSEPLDWDKLFTVMEKDALILIPWEDSRVSLKTVLNSHIARKIYIITGPEGGFSPEEVHKAQGAGACHISLGPRILRAETAAIATLTMVLYHYDCLGVLP